MCVVLPNTLQDVPSAYVFEVTSWLLEAAAAAAKLLQSCLTLGYLHDLNSAGLRWSLEKVKSLSRVRLFATP